MTPITEVTADAVVPTFTELLATAASVISTHPDVRWFISADCGDYTAPAYVTMRCHDPYSRQGLALLARKLGGRWEKEIDDFHFMLKQTIDGVELALYVSRATVCERVVIGKKTTIVEAPDPIAVDALPKTTRRVEEDVVEWRCPPSLLAGELADDDLAESEAA